MKLSLTVLAKNSEAEKAEEQELVSAIGRFAEVSVTRAPELGQMIFIDESYHGVQKFLEELEQKGQRKGRVLILMVSEAGETPSEFLAGKVDDILVRPIRPVELLSKIKQAQQVMMWDEVDRMNASFAVMIDQLRDDLKLAERMQKSRLPERFPEIRGMKIAQRYLAGMRSGGDHFDLAESKDGQQLSIVLSDSSSYGLSSAVLNTLMRVMVRLSAEESRSCADTVRLIHKDLIATLTERDRLSLFYGLVSRKDYRLRFVNLGSSSAYYAPPGGKFSLLDVKEPHIQAGSESFECQESDVRLEPGGRLILVSDGFVEASGGPTGLKSLIDEFRGRDSADLMNELVFRVKKELVEEDDLPEQDCTVVIFNLDERLIRLA